MMLVWQGFGWFMSVCLGAAGTLVMDEQIHQASASAGQAASQATVVQPAKPGQAPHAGCGPACPSHGGTTADPIKAYSLTLNDGMSPWIAARVAATTPQAPGHTPAASGAWVGLQLGEVSEVVAAQLGLEPGKSVTVLNVVKDSPADRAGLERYDLITSMNGRPVSGGVAAVIEKIGAMKPGENLSLVVQRGGKTLNLEMALAERRESFEWKYPLSPDITAEDRMNLRGRVIRPDASGAWIVEDLDDLDDLDSFPDAFKQFFPKGQSSFQRFWYGDESRSVRVERTVDGESLIVEQANDGEIHVVRKSPNGDEKTAVYADREALRKADPEAADLLEGQSVRVFSNVYGLADPRYLKELQDRLAEAEKAAREALREFHERWQKSFDQQAPPWRDEVGRLQKLLQERLTDGGTTGRTRQSFRVNADGSVEVVIRKGDSEVTRVFSSEDDLRQREPRLYERYQEVMRQD